MDELGSLLERHEAFWRHQAGGEPLVRTRRHWRRPLLENVDVTPDLLDVEELIPVFSAILEAKSLCVFGEMTMAQVDYLTQALPTGRLAIDAFVTDRCEQGFGHG